MSADAKPDESQPSEHDSQEKMAGKWPVRWTHVPEGAKKPEPQQDSK